MTVVRPPCVGNGGTSSPGSASSRAANGPAHSAEKSKTRGRVNNRVEPNRLILTASELCSSPTAAAATPSRCSRPSAPVESRVASHPASASHAESVRISASITAGTSVRSLGRGRFTATHPSRVGSSRADPFTEIDPRRVQPISWARAESNRAAVDTELLELRGKTEQDRGGGCRRRSRRADRSDASPRTGPTARRHTATPHPESPVGTGTPQRRPSRTRPRARPPCVRTWINHP